jgi:glutamate dehydrogenase
MRDTLLQNPVFSMAAEQFDRVADFLDLTEDLRERCKWPKRIITVTVPIRRDDGSTEVLFGHRVQHHLTRGPTKGGLRYHPSVDLGEITALAMWMTWKCAVADIPLGGGKGGVPVQTSNFSLTEQEELCRGFIRQIWRNIGPLQDVPAPDVGTSPRMMGWMMDEYSRIKGEYTPGVITGKPVGSGGSLGRTEATGFGVVYTIREAMKHLKMDPGKSTAAIQGFGNVAQYAAIGFVEQLGGKVVCVSCWDREEKRGVTYSRESGVNPRELQSLTDAYGSIDKSKARAAGYVIEDEGAWITKDVDVLIPSALEGQVNVESVKLISDRVKIVAEGANGPTTPEADAVFKANNVFVIPDFLCNAGGVTVSYFEGVQNQMNYYWGHQEVLDRLDTSMTRAFSKVLKMSQEENVYMRDAAYMVAIRSVVDAMELRGWL